MVPNPLLTLLCSIQPALALGLDVVPPTVTRHLAWDNGTVRVELKFSEPMADPLNATRYELWRDGMFDHHPTFVDGFPERAVLLTDIPAEEPGWEIRFTGLTDLAGNPLTEAIPVTNFPDIGVRSPAVAVHLRNPPTKNACTTAADEVNATPCDEYLTSGDLFTGYQAYVVALSANPTTMFYRCEVTLNYGPDLYLEPGTACPTRVDDTPPWPASGGSRVYRWDYQFLCTGTERPDAGGSMVLGALYVYAYGNATLELQASDMVSCALEDIPYPPVAGSTARFTAGGLEAGSNPCSAILAAPERPAARPGLGLGLAPNPTRAGSRISFEVAGRGPVRGRIFDAAGRLVRDLIDRDLPEGPFRGSWDGRDDRGVPVPSGIYLVRIETPTATESRRLVLLPR